MVFPFGRVHEGTRYRLKDLEKAQIFQTISDAGTITRKEIAAQVRSRPTTVSNVVQELIADRLVVEGDVREPGRQGRPELFLHPNFDRFAAVSVYVVSREIKGAVIGLDGRTHAAADVELPPEAGNNLVCDTIVELVADLCSRRPPSSNVLGVGLSLTGSINVAEGRWMYTARWRNIADIDLGSIETRTGLPVLSNRFVDSRLEYLLLANPELAQGGTLLFHWGYGIGAAYAFDGRVLQASLGSFAEVGHWKIAGESSRGCLCGGSGCLESVAALWALSAGLRERYGEVPEDEAEFARFFQSHDLESDELVTTARSHVAVSLANLFMTLFPERVLVYGPFTSSQRAFDRLVEEVRSATAPFVRDRLSLRLQPAGLEGDMIGSIHLLFRDALRPLLIAGRRATVDN